MENLLLQFSGAEWGRERREPFQGWQAKRPSDTFGCCRLFVSLLRIRISVTVSKITYLSASLFQRLWLTVPTCGRRKAKERARIQTRMCSIPGLSFSYLSQFQMRWPGLSLLVFWRLEVLLFATKPTPAKHNIQTKFLLAREKWRLKEIRPWNAGSLKCGSFSPSLP